MIRWISVAASLVLAGCAGTPEDSLDPESGNTALQGVAAAEPLPKPMRKAFYAIEQDPRMCPSPTCGGWWIRELNGPGTTPQYVSTLNFKPSGLDGANIGYVLQAPQEAVIVMGELGPGVGRTVELFVDEAYLGLPGVTPTVDAVYSVTELPLDCVSCPALRANLVNTSTVLSAYSLSVKSAAPPDVQLDWLHGRVLWHHALVSASFLSTTTSDAAQTIDASQVWIKLADAVGPCPPSPASAVVPCADGLVPTYTRDQNRCLLFDQCVKPGACPLPFVACQAGYRFASWAVTPNGCDTYACDPGFVAP
ncbi:MAG: DUF6748 domain-containing protein [Myxococcaceae bacterium]